MASNLSSNLSSNVFAVAAHNMKNNNAKLGCLQLVMRDTISSYKDQHHTQNDDVTQEPRIIISTRMPSFGYDPLSLGVPCNNSVRYDPFTPVRQCERTTESFSQASYSSASVSASSLGTFDDSAFDDSAWESMDKDIDDAIEREMNNENEEYFDIETGLMNFSFAGETKSWQDTLHVLETPTHIPSSLDPKIEVNSTEIPTQGAWNAWSAWNDWSGSSVWSDKNETHTTPGQPTDQPIGQIFPPVSPQMNFKTFKTCPVMSLGTVC